LKTVFNIVLVALFGLLAYQVTATLGSGDLFGFQYKGQDVSLTTFAGITLATLLGTILGSIYAFIGKQAQSTTSWWRLMADAVKTPRFGMSLLVTPIVVFVVFDQIDLKNADFGVALFCLQSGFFWDRTFDAIAGKASPVAASEQVSGSSPQ
jgi:hypothetical protein